MRLPGMQQAQLVASPLQFLVEILVGAQGGLDPNRDLIWAGLSLTQALQQLFPPILAEGFGDGFDHHLFLWPHDAAGTGLASTIHPTDLLDARFRMLGRQEMCVHLLPALFG